MLDKISEKVGNESLEYPDNGDIKIVIFDDLVNEDKKIMSRTSNYCTNSRHHSLNPVFLTQYHTGFRLKIKVNCTHMIVYEQKDEKRAKVTESKNQIDIGTLNKLQNGSRYDFCI